MKLEDEWNEIIKGNTPIYIYGAGKYGKKILNLLKQTGRNTDVLGFIVSDVTNNPLLVEGIPVLCITDIQTKDILIFLAVADKYQEEIIKLLKENEFTNYVNVYKYAFLEESSITDVLSVEELLNKQYCVDEFGRLDIIVRILAVEEYYGVNSFGMGLYKKMQENRVRNGYGNISQKRFMDLILSVKKYGYDSDSEILVDDNYRLVDGAHRLALAIYHHYTYVKVRVVSPINMLGYGKEWFEKYFTEEECNVISKKLRILLDEIKRDGKTDIEKLKEKISILLGKKPDFGQGRFYQSFEELNIEGQRPTKKRIDIYGLKNIVKDKTVFDIGCNCGFMDLALGIFAQKVEGVEYNNDLVKIAELVRKYLKRDNVCFFRGDFKSFNTEKKYDVVLSFAVHYWIGLPAEEYCRKVVSMIETDGYLIFESQRIESDTDFDIYCETFEQIGMKKIIENMICDDGEIKRKYLIYKNCGMTEKE